MKGALRPPEKDETLWSCLEEWQPWVLEGTYRLYSLGLEDADSELDKSNHARVINKG